MDRHSLYWSAFVVLLVAAQAATKVKYCIPYTVDDGYVAGCTEVMQQANNDELTFSCVSGGSTYGCMKKLSEGSAHLTTADGGEMYIGYNRYSLLPLLSESYGGEFGTEYYGVAVVHKDMCSSDTTLRSLEGKEACSTGYKRTVGWMMPMGTLLSTDTMPAVNNEAAISDDAESAAAFFSKICAYQNDGPVVSADGSMQSDPKLCSLCKGKCDNTDEYASYGGALRCLLEEEKPGSRVAFVKHTTVDDFSSSGELAKDWASSVNKEDLRLVCPAGGCMEVDKFEQCNFGKVPAHALLAPASLNKGGEQEDLGKSIQDALSTAGKNKEWLDAAKEYQGDDLIIFAGDTVGVDPVSVSGLEDFVEKQALDNYATVFSTMKPARFCVVNDEDLEHCNTIVQALAVYNSSFQWGCLKMESAYDCFEAIANGRAELKVVDGAELYEAAQLFSDIVPIAAEFYDESGEEGTEYYAVAVVNKDVCESRGNITLADLRGKNSCHTGYGRGAGWRMPLGALASAGVIEMVDTMPMVSADAQSMAGFFGKLCAAGLQASGPMIDENGVAGYYDPLCDICKNTTDGVCAKDDQFYDYEGAFRCLVEGAGDVAFTKHVVPLEYAADGTEVGSWSTKKKEDLRLLCREGGCAELDEYKECNLAKTPAHTIVSNEGYLFFDDLQSVLVAASTDSTTAAVLFAPEDFWGEATQKLTKTSGDAKEYLGSTYDVYKALYDQGWLELPAPGGDKSMKYCIPYPANSSVVETCNDVMREANNETSGVTFVCVAGGSAATCMKMISNGTADLTTLDGGDQFTANSRYGLVPVVAESYNSSSVSYYAVAVVKSDFCTDGVTLASLKDKNTCHTGYGKTAGWKMPVGYMIRNNIITVPEKVDTGVNPDAQALSDFAASTCAPRTSVDGPKVSSNGTTELWDKLCENCAGDCTSTTEEPYYDYAGALRCLMEGKGDVAFVKHSTPLDYAKDGATPENWATLNQDDLRLLCADAGCKSLDEYSSCALAKVPAHAIVGRKDMVGSDAVAALVAAGEDPEWISKATTIGGLANTIFKKGTTGMLAVTNFEDFFGEDAVSNMQAIAEINKPTALFCVHSPEEKAFCDEKIEVLNVAQSQVVFECYFSEAQDCVAAIKLGAAHVSMFDSHDAWTAVTVDGLDVAVAENYKTSTKAYYAVAVTTKEFCEERANAGLNKETLQNKNSCHTGFQRSAGWIVPVGYLLLNDIMPYVKANDTITNDAESVASFFNQVCAGRTVNNGPINTDDGTGALWSELCGACGSRNDTTKYCTVDDIYYNYEGAVRGVMEGKCDFGFTKHETVLAMVKGAEGAPAWATMSEDDMRLLCPNKGCSPIDDYALCSIAAVPPHSGLVKADASMKEAIQAALVSASENKDVVEAFFTTASNPEDFVFKSSTKKLVSVENGEDFFGNIASAFKGFDQGMFTEPDTTEAGRK